MVEGRFQGQGDSPLSPMGRRQAELAAARLADPRTPPSLAIPAGPPVEIRHSPLERTTATASAAAAALTAAAPGRAAAPMVADAGLLEIGQGDWEGRFSSEIESAWGERLEGWRRDPLTTWAPGGESLPEVDGRVRPALGATLARLRGRGVLRTTHGSQVLGYQAPVTDEPWALLVGHDGASKVALLALLDLPLSRFWSFPFALCGICIVEIRAGRARLRAHNLTEHLAGLEGASAAATEVDRGRAGAL